MIALIRTHQNEAGTFGHLLDEDGALLCYTVENTDHIIEAKTYTFRSYQSPTKGNVWLRDDKAADDGRLMIEIHAANWARQLIGCIGVGRNIQLISGVMGVTDSVNTMKMLKSKLPDTFELTITEDFDV